MKGFVKFIREQGVVGLAVGFILGGAVSKLVSSLVENIINPLVGMLLGKVDLADKVVHLSADTTLRWGAVVSTLIDFVIIAGVVYFGVSALKLDKLDSEKDK